MAGLLQTEVIVRVKTGSEINRSRLRPAPDSSERRLGMGTTQDRTRGTEPSNESLDDCETTGGE